MVIHPPQQAVPGEYEKRLAENVIDEFDMSREKLEQIISEMMTQFDNALSEDTTLQASSCFKMLPTYVRSIPTGSEQGDYFALDLGGTNFRVLHVTLAEDKPKLSHETYAISQSLMTGNGPELFEYIAECLAAFVKAKLGADTQSIPVVGFTFSFPVNQTSLTSGDLIKWTKGFTASGVEKKDIVKLLQQAIDKRKEITVEKIALLNDTTGVMMSCAYEDQDVAIGLILGTGTNACYMEQLDKIKKSINILPNDTLPRQIILNTEWGAFGQNGELNQFMTMHDKTIDAESVNPGGQLYEKLISGMYLGEIVRYCLIDLIKKFVLFRGQITPQIAEKQSFKTMYVSDICSGEARRIVEILTDLGYEQAALFECQIVQDVCNAVSLRAARLSAAGLSAIVRRLNRNSLTVGVDGSLFKKHPTFKRYMQRALDELLPTTYVKLRLAEDGSGRGAALVAAVAKDM